MKVVGDVLLLLCLHEFDLRVTVKAGQALACLYSEARLYKGPGPANPPQSAATRSTGKNLRVDKESRPQQHTWNSEFFVLLPLKITTALSLHFQHLYEDYRLNVSRHLQ